MLTALETLTIAGWHPDAGLWPLLAVTVVGLLALAMRGGK